MDSNAFAQVLAGFQGTYEQAQSYSSWTPPEDGLFTVRIKERVHGLSGKGNEEKRAWIKLVCTIEQHENLEYNGKEWGAFFFTSQAFGFMKDFLATVTGVAPTSVVDAYEQLGTLDGTLLLVNKETVLSKAKKEVSNVKVVKVLETVA